MDMLFEQGQDLYSSASRGISVAVLSLNHVLYFRGEDIALLVSVLQFCRSKTKEIFFNQSPR